MNPFELKPQKADKIFTEWKKVLVKPYDKRTVDPYTRLRVILMSGTEFESVRCSHAVTRQCPNNDVRRRLAYMRRGEQLQQKRVAALKPSDESILEHTIGYEQLAVDLTANLALSEKNGYVRKQLDFALLEDFDHLYRYADLMELEKGGDPAQLVGDYTEIMPGRPTVAEYRHPYDDVNFYINGYLNDLKTKLNINIITAAEQQTMNFYMNVGAFYPTDAGRKMYSEIAMIEEQHVTGYGSLMDTECTWLENLLMHEYTECYLYYSCWQDETDQKVKRIWEKHFEDEVAHLHYAKELLLKYEGKEWQQVIPTGEFPELLSFHENKEYIRNVLKSVRMTAFREGFEHVNDVPDNHEFFQYQKIVNANLNEVPSHKMMKDYIRKNGEDMRFEIKPHPEKILRSRTEDNYELARKKGV